MGPQNRTEQSSNAQRLLARRSSSPRRTALAERGRRDSCAGRASPVARRMRKYAASRPLRAAHWRNALLQLLRCRWSVKRPAACDAPTRRRAHRPSRRRSATSWTSACSTTATTWLPGAGALIAAISTTTAAAGWAGRVEFVDAIDADLAVAALAAALAAARGRHSPHDGASC